MAQLVFTSETDIRSIVEIYDNDGRILFQRKVNRYSERDQAWLASITGWTTVETTEYLNQAHNEGEPLVLEVDIPLHRLQLSDTPALEHSTSQVFTLTIREINAPRTTSREYQDILPQDALKNALQDIEGVEPILEWQDIRKLACLDIDYHNIPLELRMDREEIYDIVRNIKPQPYCWHPSHAGGAKLYYVAAPGYTADELAAVAGLSWHSLDPRSTFDILKSSRHPCFDRTKDSRPAPCSDPREIEYMHGHSDIGHLRAMLVGELEYPDMMDLIESNGWKLGQTLPHSECRISPDNRDRLTVFVGESGLFCHSCAARGITVRGSSRPGFYPYSLLTDSYLDSKIGVMVKNFCHAEHAKIVLQNIYPDIPEHILTRIYKILLKVYHTPDDPRIELCMIAGRGVVRTRGVWCSSDGTTPITKAVDQLVRSLPSVLIPAPKGKFKINSAKVVALMNAGDISDMGYPDITFIRGCKIYGQFLPKNEDETIKVITRKEFQYCPPKYLPSHQRMTDEETWGIIETEFPGIDRNYLKLIIAAKGAAEGRLAQCPYLLITGVSGSGKSTTAHIASGMCGEKAEEIVFTPNIERYRSAFMDAAKHSGILVINEIFKDARANKLSPIQALNPMLTITEDSRSHLLYTGSVPFGRLPLFILTDIECPPEVIQDIQIARRFTYYRLSKSVHWDETLIKRRIRPYQFRLISADHALAADSLLSSIIDEFFKEPHSLAEMAERLQADTYDSEGVEERDRVQIDMKEFYLAVLASPELTSDTDKSRYPNGYKKIMRRDVGTGKDRLADLWNDLCDGHGDDDWYSSRAITQVDWSEVVGTDFPIRCRIAPYKANRCIYLRFESTDGRGRRLPTWINGRSRL